jgi:phosphoglycerate kinase
MPKLSALSAKQKISGKRIFLRVDWNVPLAGMEAEDSLKVSRSLETIKDLAARGAIVLVATHLGRPQGREEKYSTKKLLELVTSQYKVPMRFLGDALDTAAGVKAAQKTLSEAEAGSVFLLENVRFYVGEEKNAAALSKAFASLADIFVNDAFASCHRAHASVVGIAKHVPHCAGPNLIAEVHGLEKLITKPKKPFMAVIGGAKISTKIDVIQALLTTADAVFVGGAMANAFFAAQKKEIGKSFVEKEGIVLAKKLLKNPKLVLPIDVVVARKIERGVKARSASVDEVKKTEAIGDIGPQTMLAWSQMLKKAQTIVWNGPLGVSEISTFSHGSLVIARAISVRSKGKAYGVAGGGDTLPILFASGMSSGFDHISTGGGAMLEFIAKKGKLPGLVALLSKT